MRKPSIAFTGGQGSGKTTVAKYIIDKFGYDYFYINQTRLHITDYFGGNLYNAREHNRVFQNSLLSNKIEWETTNKEFGFVTDRTTIDNLAYFMLYSNSEDITYSDYIEYYDKAMAHTASCYDYIFCFSPLYNTPYDSLSPPHTLDKVKVYYTIMGLLEQVKFKNNIYYIQDLDRMQKVTKILSDLGVKKE